MMKHDEIDRILSREDEILPSSGFAVSVMDAVRREASAPPPIPFPWKRAMPGLVAAGVVLVLVLVGGSVAVGQPGTATSPDLSLAFPSLLSSVFGLQRNVGSATIWTTLGLVASLVSVKLSMRLASGRG
jgi:hypothetical protein